MSKTKALSAVAVLSLAVSLWFILAFHGFLPLPGLSGYRFLTVVTGSMEPELPTGCIITVKCAGNQLLSPGDIITYSAKGIYITHRISEVGFDGTFYYQTKGDANKNPDPYVVRTEDVLGQVIYVTPPLISGLLGFIRSGASLAILTAMLLCIALAAIARAPKKIPKPGGKYNG